MVVGQKVGWRLLQPEWSAHHEQQPPLAVAPSFASPRLLAAPPHGTGVYIYVCVHDWYVALIDFHLRSLKSKS